MNTYVIGDIHGEYDKLKECLNSVNFDYEVDRIISLGDLTDRGLKNWEVVQEFTKIKNKVMVMGNHDVEFLIYLKGKRTEQWWIYHGGSQTMDSYEANGFLNKEEHIKLMESQVPYFIEGNACFVHGGLDWKQHIAKQTVSTFTWDRELIVESMQSKSKEPIKFLDGFERVFIGHTPTTYYKSDLPTNKRGVINLDTGSGKGGKLTIWNLETNEYKQA